MSETLPPKNESEQEASVSHESTYPGLPTENFKKDLDAARLALKVEQGAVDSLNFKSSATDRIEAQARVRKANDELGPQVATLEAEWQKYGGEAVDAAQARVEALNFKSSATDRVEAFGALSQAKEAWANAMKADKETQVTDTAEVEPDSLDTDTPQPDVAEAQPDTDEPTQPETVATEEEITRQTEEAKAEAVSVVPEAPKEQGTYRFHGVTQAAGMASEMAQIANIRASRAKGIDIRSLAAASDAYEGVEAPVQKAKKEHRGRNKFLAGIKRLFGGKPAKGPEDVLRENTAKHEREVDADISANRLINQDKQPIDTKPLFAKELTPQEQLDEDNRVNRNTSAENYRVADRNRRSRSKRRRSDYDLIV